MLCVLWQLCRNIYGKYFLNKKPAPGEARTHGLQIMRLTRCLLRYRGLQIVSFKILFTGTWKIFWSKIMLPTGGLEPPIFGLGDRRLIH